MAADGSGKAQAAQAVMEGGKAVMEGGKAQAAQAVMLGVDRQRISKPHTSASDPPLPAPVRERRPARALPASASSKEEHARPSLQMGKEAPQAGAAVRRGSRGGVSGSEGAAQSSKGISAGKGGTEASAQGRAAASSGASMWL